MKKKIIFWVVVIVLLLAFGLWLKYASFGLGGIVLGWIGKILYDRYVKE